MLIIYLKGLIIKKEKFYDKRKKLITIITAIVISLIYMNLYVYATENEKLSEMTEEEYIEFVKSQGAEIPDEYKDYRELGSTIKEMIIYIEAHPEAEHIYNYTAKHELFTNIREVVLKYYDIEIKSNSFISMYSNTATSSLKYSRALYSWNEGFRSYNCYGYAIDVIDNINPGYKVGAGYDANTISTISVERFADLAASDLRLLGYTEVTYGSTRPSYQSGYKVIAVRKYSDDFHFMAETSSNVWRHKPGDSVILQFNYSSPALGKWTDEGIGRYGLQGGNNEYTSNIMYIRYKLK